MATTPIRGGINPCSTRVSVNVRSRPLVTRMDESESTLPDDILDMNELEGQVVVALEKTFAFDAVFDANSCQATVYSRSIQDLVTKFVYDTANVTVMAYGQTGAGKTHTMIGKTQPPGDDDRGVIPRALEDAFATVDEDTDTIRISFFEILNEKIYDLLKNARSKVPLGLRQEGHRFLIGDLSSPVVASVEEAIALLNQGCAIRSTGATAQNETSSRSHAIFRMELFRDNGHGDRHEAKMSLVDLAGSESVRKTQASGERLAEANNINRGLLALGKCVSDICSGQKHIPFRDSTLTKVLKDSLEGQGCWTSMISCVSPSETDMTETLNTLRYADRAKQMKKPSVPAHLLKHAQAQAKKRRLAQMIPPTPAAWKRPKLNSTIETPTPTKRKKPRPENRLNSTTPVQPTFITPSADRSFAQATGGSSSAVRKMDFDLREFDDQDDSASASFAGGGGKTTPNENAFGSCSDLSSIGGADTGGNNGGGGRATSSVVSGPTTHAGASSNLSGTMSATMVDASVLSPLLRKYADQLTEQLEKKIFSRLEETIKQGSASVRRSPRLNRDDPKSVVIDKARASITELVEHNLRKHQQAEVLPPIPGSASTGEIIKSKPVLGELNHRKKHLQRVEQTASPALRRSIGGTIIEDDDKENSTRMEEDSPLTRTLTPCGASVETPTKPPSNSQQKTPSMSLAEMTVAMGIDPDSPGMADMFNDSPTKKPPPPENRKRSSRRTTMLAPELTKSIRESMVSNKELLGAASRRRSVRIAKNSTSAGPESEGSNSRKSDFKQPLQVSKNWKVANQDDHNKSLLRLLNSANLKMLQSLPTVGPKTAYLIHSHRELHNGFDSFEDLKNVPGLQKNFFDKFVKVHQIVLPGEEA